MQNISQKCCICLENNEKLINIDEKDENNVVYSDKLLLCAPNQHWSDKFKICIICADKLNNAYDFVQLCIKNDIYRTDNVKDKNFNFEENVPVISEFSCDLCKRAFKCGRTLKLHITRMHKNTKKNEINKTSDADTNSNVACEISDKNTRLKPEIDKENIVSSSSQDKTEYKDDSDLEDNIFDEKNDSNDSSYSEGDIIDEAPKVSKKRSSKNKQPLVCNYCGLSMYKKHLFHAHIRSKHTFEKPFSCDLCDSKYMNAYSLLIHKRKHNNEKPFICAMCGKSFISSADLNHHNKTHNTERNYACNHCDRSFKTHSNLRTHRLQMHLDPKDWKFMCTVCDKKFPIRGNLVKHMKRHTGIKEFGCHICDKKFINKAELNLHLNTHSNNRLFKCNICLKEYKNREGLRRHMKVVHDLGNWKAPKVDKKYLCPSCPKTFAYSNKLHRHMCTHTGEKPFVCEYCPKRFVDNYCKKVHLKKDHNIEFL